MTTNRTGSTQRDNIKKHLKDGYSLTALEALSLFGAYRLAAHIEVLRKRGMPIVTTMNTDVTGRTYARYSLNKSVAAAIASSVQLLKTNDVPGPYTVKYPQRQKELTYHAH